MAEFDPGALALSVSDSDRAQAAAAELVDLHPWVPFDRADTVVVVGGDGYMLHVLHQMLEAGRVVPAYGVNLGTFGFLMNKHRDAGKLLGRIAKARAVMVHPLVMDAVTQGGETHRHCAINEVSLFRETRQTARIEISVNDKVRIKEMTGDGVLVATPAGSTAYNFSANGPILPLDSGLLALTPLSPFRPRRWRGAILPNDSRVTFRVLEPDKRPVSVVADQKEVRDIAEVRVAISEDVRLQLLFDPGHALDDRIVAEQFTF